LEPKKIIQNVCPPILWGLAKQLRRSLSKSSDGEITFNGDYKSWEEAEKASTGYSAPQILARTRAALLKVRDGKTAFERDSVIFNAMQHEFPLLAGLLRASCSNSNQLSVLDFGGSLGSTYFQCRKFLSTLTDLRWSVVDQPAQVTCGQTDFANEQLHFYGTTDECLRVEKPNVLLLSSVLQYVPKPYVFLDDILQHRWRDIIVDRTAFLCEEGDLLTVQHVPDWIYGASYPAWFLSKERFLNSFKKDYHLVASFRALDNLHPKGKRTEHKGFIFSLKH